MARTFANPSGVTLAAGNAGVLNGAWTFAAIVRRTSDNDFHVLISQMAGATHRGGLWITNGGGAGGGLQVVSNGADVSFGLAVPTSTWVCLAAAKEAGVATPHGWVYRYDTNAFSDVDATGTLDDDSNTITSVGLGTHSSDWYFIGDYHLAGVWNTRLPDPVIRQLPFSLQAWYASVPRGGWLLDQHATTQAVIDWTGGGANQTALTGTTVSAQSVPVWTYGFEVSAPHSVPAADGTPIGVGDGGSSAETTTVSAAAPLAETGSAADTASSMAATPLTDAAAANETTAISAGVPTADAGVADQALTAAAAAPLADSASASDGLVVDTGGGTPKPVGDTGSATDALTLAAGAALADVAAGAEALTAAAALALADAASATDAATTAASVPLTQSGAASDALATSGISVGLADGSAAGDALAITVTVGLTDVAGAADLGAGQDESFIPKALADAAAAADRLRIAIVRPNTGTVARPNSGVIVRPNSGVVLRP